MQVGETHSSPPEHLNGCRLNLVCVYVCVCVCARARVRARARTEDGVERVVLWCHRAHNHHLIWTSKGTPLI
jgi:hypothetical protein